MKKFLLLNLIFLGSLYSQDYYYEKYAPFDENIKSPEEFLGYPIGEMHTRHDLIVSYMTYLSNTSDKADMFSYATSYEGRKLIYLIVSSPEKIKNIETIPRPIIPSLLWANNLQFRLIASFLNCFCKFFSFNSSISIIYPCDFTLILGSKYEYDISAIK